jgi:YidC/Oxa1 family membrane protein insertase
MLEAIYLTTGLPWWATIVATTLVFRLALFPIVVKTQRAGAMMNNLKPVIQPLQDEMNRHQKAKDHAAMQTTMLKMRAIYKEAGTSPFTMLWGLVQAPVFISFFLALRKMAELPVPGFDKGGLLWITDLTMSDPTWIMPLIASGTMLAVMEVKHSSLFPSLLSFKKIIIIITFVFVFGQFGMDAGAAAAQSQAMKTIFRGMLVLFIPFTAALPSVSIFLPIMKKM